MLPKDYNARKALPIFTFLTEYFPDAILELVKVSVAGNIQHNPGEELHWARGKSMDQLNTAMRHQFDHGMGNVFDEESEEVKKAIGGNTMHLAKAAWRLLAEIQLIKERHRMNQQGCEQNAQKATPAHLGDRLVGYDRGSAGYDQSRVAGKEFTAYDAQVKEANNYLWRRKEDQVAGHSQCAVPSSGRQIFDPQG